ncbi:MAG: NAD(P)/FAD-dependent oxidoreductase [Fimbriimonas sp.]
MTPYDTIVIGGGFAGLSAAYDLVRAGKRVLVLEADGEVGGLAGSFDVGGTKLEKFYHHWFTNDRHVMDLIKELGPEDRILLRPTRTGMYYAKNFFRLSTPKDLLSFSALPFLDRIRLGLLALRARKVEDWRELEDKTAEEWLVSMGGRNVYDTVWKPMLAGKFGRYAPQISAVWFWNKLKLRGGSRGKGGEEVLAYYRGGFAHLAETLAAKVVELGGEIRLRTAAHGIAKAENGLVGVSVAEGELLAKTVLVTVPLPIFADMLPQDIDPAYRASLGKITYIANTCLVLELDRSLSDTYWINVADPNFPYVGVIEHTNFEPPETYAGKHIVYLSKYLPEDEPLYRMTPEETLEYSLPHIQRMFPHFDRKWITNYHVWKARYSQPIVVKNYSKLIPPRETPIPGVYLASMAQVYPEDRGTNYAIRDGREVAKLVAKTLL